MRGSCLTLTIIDDLTAWRIFSKSEVFLLAELTFVEMDCGASDVIENVKCLGAVTWEQARYSLCFDSLVEELNQEKNKLEANIEDINENVRESQENTIKVGKRLELELKESKDVIKEVDELVNKVKPKKTCCDGPCPDLIWQYRLGRQVASKTEAMKQLNAQFQPPKFSRIQSLPGMEYYSSEDFIHFKSTKKASDELLKALKNPNIRRIGLYGMGGCGKTTLAKKVGDEVQKLFKKVVFVTVSSTVEVRKIQGSIADQLKLTLKEECESERAKRLSMRLSGSEKILIILDDVWEELEFDAIGIPFRDNCKGCRILLTTRHRGVCVSLKCEMVRLDLISEKEAWQLFKKHAGINDDASEKSLKGLPQVINKACKGLPVAVAAIASALKGKSLDDWKKAFHSLKHYEQVDTIKSKDPYASVRLSYDHLEMKEAQDLFLLCSLFPEDSEIKEENLIRMGTGLGLFKNAYSCDRARSIGGSAINKLLDSFLLLQAKEGLSVMLHDIFRAVALRIADKQIQTILEPTLPPSLMELPEHEDTEAITKLYCQNIKEFPLQFKCPKLEILIVSKDGKGSPEVPDEFFSEMGGLKVLIMNDKSSWQNSTLMLPKSIWSLKCLRTLCIRGCRLDFIFLLKQLQHLEILEFCNCSILQLPNDIAELKKLKLLDVSRCRVRGNPYKVLGNCPRLEELYFSEIDLDQEELKDQNLAEFFGKNDYLTKLERYNVQIGARVDKLKDDMKSGFLSICPYSDQDTSTSTRAIKALAQRAEVLFLENIPKSCKNVIPDIVYQEGDCLKDLIELLLCNSEGIKCLIDTSNQLNQIGTVFSKLHKLRITRMNCLEGFCHGKPPRDLFKQLKELECSQLPVLSSLGKLELSNLVILKLESCPKLESLFTPAIAVSLVQLKELKITKCHGLMYIIGDDKEEDVMDENDQKSYASVFTNLKELVVGDCKMLEYLIPLSFACSLGNLEILTVYLAPKLKYVFGKYNCTRQSYNQNENETLIINFSKLKRLELLNLEEIISICPENYNANFPEGLQWQVHECPNFPVIVPPNASKVDSEIEEQVQVQQDGEPSRKIKFFFPPLGTSTVAENIKEWVYAPIRQARYSLSFNKYVEDLRTEKETLKFTRQSLQDRAERETLEIDGDVKEWLVNAGILIEEAEKLEQKAITNRSYCLGHFPNCIQRYRMGKQAARKINAIIKHNQSREFQKFSQRALLSRMEDYFQGDFVLFDSRRSLYYSLLESLKEDEISIIGLYGIGGCGKTTLAKQVAKEAESIGLFDRVVFVVVSESLNVRKIQERIARSLDLELEEETLSARAKQLYTRLASGERILLILDDVWERLDLEVMGIPFGVNHKGCSMLIVSRFREVCTVMDCQRMLALHVLTEEEGWALFKKHALISEDTNDSLKYVARKVSILCHGLPIVIAAVASTMKGKTEVEWKEALDIFRSEDLIEEGWQSVTKALKLSYGNLTDKNAKSLFLLCSIFPKDFEIHEEYLTRYGIILGLFGGVSSYKRVRNRVNAAKKKLIDSCLLLKDDEGQCVKIHDVIHDVALYMAKNEIIVMERIYEERFRNTTTLRYLWIEKADEFPNELDFPKLEFLYLGFSESSILPDEFFKGMKCLRVLVLHCKSYYQDKPSLTLTKSILSLSNLGGLFLEGWELGDLSFVASLNRLEALVLWSCSFKELPKEITELRKLQLLDLSECTVEKDPYEAIGRCSQLEELYITGNSCSEWKDQSSVAFFQENEISLKLERYRIEIGGTSRVFQKGDFSTSRALSIHNFDASTSTPIVKNLLRRAEVLSLGQISGGCENNIPDMLGEGMNKLIELRLCNSDEIKCITDTAGHVRALFPSLTKLRIQSLKHMEALCYGPIPAGLFVKLKKLELYDCPLLEYLFTGQSLKMLEVMIIAKCDRLEHIIWNKDAAEEERLRNNYGRKNISAFPKLELLIVQECQQLYCLGYHWLLNLCSLKKLIVESCSKLEFLFSSLTANTMTSLEELIIKKSDSLKELFGYPYIVAQTVTLPRLKMLKFTELPNLEKVSEGFKLQHVIYITVEGCPKFRGQNPVKGSSSSVATAVQRSSRRTIAKEDRDTTQTSLTKDANLNEEDQRNSSKKEMGSIFDLPMHHCENFVNENGHSGTTNEETSLRTIIEPVQVQASLEIDQNVHGINFRRGGDSQTQEFDTSNNPENASTETSEKYSVATSIPGGKDSDSPSARYHVDLNAPLATTNSEYQSSEEGGNQKKMEEMNVIEQGATQTGIPLPVYNDISKDIKSDMLPKEMLTPEGGEVQDKGLYASINPIDTTNKLQEQEISPIGSLCLIESIGENGLPSEKSTVEISSLDMVKKASNNQPISMDHQEEAFEENKVFLGNMPTGFDLQKAIEQGKHEHYLDNLNTGADFSEEGGNQKKMEEMNVIEQGTTQTGIPLPVYNHIGKDIKSDMLPKEMLTPEGGEVQDKGLYASINPIDTTNKLQEQEISPIGSLCLIESIGETTMVCAQNGLPSEKSTVEISSLDMVKKASNNQSISMDHQEEAFEENKVSLGNMPIGFDRQKAIEQGKHEHHLDNLNTRADFLGKATLELPSSLLVAQNVDITTPPVDPAPVSSVSLAYVHALPTQVDPTMHSSTGKLMTTLEEEYVPFRDTVAIKKKHIPLLEQAIASYPSLWDWHEKPMHPKMKQFGYTMLGDMLEFLSSTMWRDLTEERKAEFQSLLDGLETLGFDTQWLANTCARIKKSNAINRMKMLELQVMTLEGELKKTKQELSSVRVELENLNNLIGF
ncbi:hypothetical protein L6164_031585 [Bauhinia variegata]|uniref:Uncharacterized protein n=1 Tax=Bauhinia variegata TaxID=167791 RepID=A0ACB9LFX1_BAUVA|nr:hypothetical protein L6164_031585 [Bauhinia variegata]